MVDAKSKKRSKKDATAVTQPKPLRAARRLRSSNDDDSLAAAHEISLKKPNSDKRVKMEVLPDGKSRYLAPSVNVLAQRKPVAAQRMSEV
jgi:hypothetical protein